MAYTPKELMAEIRRRMILKDVQMKELAALMDTTQQNISNIFKNANPKYSTLLQICESLNLDIEIYFTEKKDDSE
ncbi:helix-turn-helix transcriptional regulator [Clostridium sp. WB02_MRS01]|uniref:helix-turn-helix domain-containing protein n=1 Tax=Clostridium sp. WB02_MRS01 TaxID=2605777 RepID=UPI0012B3D2E5|nr:helix-turn-helix transcriptional regulator [Clostridium sp. WB02_MRS01]MSS11748.1 helix-turn-helix transcriptional regulator [Clostridium sp. WB02_MRS01]